MKLKFSGFTLIELLVATSVFVVVLVAMFNAFHTGIFGYRAVEERIESEQIASQLLTRLNSDLRSAFAYDSQEEDAHFTGSAQEVDFLATIIIYNGNIPVSTLARITYRLEGGKLMRRACVNQDSLNEKSDTPFEEVADSLTAFNMRFITFDPDSKQTKEQDDWAQTGSPNDEKKKMPDGVKVNFTITQKGTYSFDRTIFLP
ncbi:MAG: prepilin-type N-terminal cleavage/methylation domain-containing protein [Candidatus Omnitrophica bacterium]|nr:prepilin-type N-terminal cleavage/methylation domain-containing protein [Candidatus Omnitrophota bacterium]